MPVEESGAVAGKSGETTENGLGQPANTSGAPGASASVFPASGSRIHRAYWALLALVTVFLSLPILTVRYLSFTDYPSHLASIYVMFHYHDTPAYQHTFTFNLAPIPDIAFDVIGPLLLHFMGLFTAGRVFLILTLLLFVTGCHLLGKAIHGRETWLAIACCFFFYNLFLFTAEMNFLFGLALFAIALAFTLRWRERWNAKTLTLASILYCCTYLAHLGGYAFLGFTVVTLAAFELLTRRISLRRAALGIIPLVPPLVLFFLFMGRGGTAGNGKFPIIWKSDLGSYITGAVTELITYNHRINRVYVAVAAAIVLVLLYQIFRRKVSFSKPVMLAGIVLLILWFFCPIALFTSDMVDERFVPAALLLIFLSLKIRGSRRLCAALLGIWLIMSVARVSLIWGSWRKFDPVTAAGIQMVETLPTGAKIYPFQPYPAQGGIDMKQWPFFHVPTYAVIYKQAYDPSLWAVRSAEPLVFRVDPHYYDRQPEADRARALESYDYAWSRVVSPEEKQILERECTPILKKDGFTLWKVNRNPSGEPAREGN